MVADGREVNVLKRTDPFRLRDRANCRVTNCRLGEAEDVLSACHDGYRRVGVEVRRTFVLNRREESLAIQDRIIGAGRHRLVWRIHFAPEVAWRDPTEPSSRGETVSGSRCGFPEGSGLRADVEQAWYSPSYGVRSAAPALRIEADFKGVYELDVNIAGMYANVKDTNGEPHGHNS